MATIAQLIGIDHKKNSMTWDELLVALNKAKSNLIVLNTPGAVGIIDGLITGIGTYVGIQEISNAAITALPKLKTASKAAVAGMIPTVTAEITADTTMATANAATDLAKSVVDGVKNTVLSTEIPGT